MKITVTSTMAEAIKKGRNNERWQVEVDVAKLSENQREYLARVVNSRTDTIDSHYPGVDNNGDITPNSIQAAIDAEIVKRDSFFADKMAQAESLYNSLREGENKGIYGLFDGDVISDYKLSDEQLAAKKEIVEKIKAEEQKIVEKKDKAKKAYDLSMMEAVKNYENGVGDRPTWEGDWQGSDLLLGQIQKADKERKKAERERLEAGKGVQLASIVHQHGTASQRERWAAGVLPEDEQQALLQWAFEKPLIDAGLDTFMIDEDLLGESLDSLIDVEWLTVKKIKENMPNAELAYYNYLDDDCGPIIAIVSDRMGLFDMECGVVLS